jgi:serine/threonine-protein kinase
MRGFQLERGGRATPAPTCGPGLGRDATTIMLRRRMNAATIRRVPLAAVDPFGLIGQLLDGQFRVDAVIGEGGFSAVYRGTHVGLDEPIAIKCLKLTGISAQGSAVVDSFVRRFRDESRILYRLGQGNLNVVRCMASGTTTSPTTGALVPYMVLEWLEGQTLEGDLRARTQPRSLAEMMSLLEPVADAITYAHTMGVIHRDLSTGNIFLAKQRATAADSATPGGATRAKVLDFGVAKVISDDLELGPRTQTLSQIRIFSPAYAAPEQFDSRLAPAGPYTDVYSLALIAVEVLTGRSVRTSQTLGEMMEHALDPKAARTPRACGANVSDAVEQVFARALSIEASKRQKDVGELWRELRGAQSVAFGRPPMDLGTTTRVPPRELEEKPPSTDPSAPPVAVDGSAAGGTSRTPNEIPAEVLALKSTVRMASSPPQPAALTTTTASPLFQPVAVPLAPGAPLAAPSGSFAALAPERPPANNPALKQTRAPMSARSLQRAQWLVGLLVFILVLAAGSVALRFFLK